MFVAREIFESVDEWMGAMEFAGYSHCHLIFVRKDGQAIVLFSSDENRVQKFEQFINEDFEFVGLVFFDNGTESKFRAVDTNNVPSEAVGRVWHAWLNTAGERETSDGD